MKKSNWVSWKNEQERKRVAAIAMVATDVLCMAALAAVVIFTGFQPQM